MDENRIHLLLTKLTGNTINEAEFEELMLLMRQADTEETVQPSFDKAWAELQPGRSLPAEEATRLYEQIKENPRFTSPAEGRVVSPRRWLAYAAALFLLIGAGIAAWLVWPSPAPPALVYEEVAAPAGKRVRLVLADNTEVWLNNGSKLRYPVAFTGNTRELYVEGEACFDVTRRDQQPFIVHSGKIAVKVLGTVFNVRAYQQAPLSVTVISGKVSVATGARTLGVLQSNQQLEYETGTGQARINSVAAADQLAWTKGELILDNVTMEEAANTIARWYNVQVQFENAAVKKCRFSLSFLHGEQVQEVMKMICELNHCTWKQTGQTIVISGNGC